MTNEPMKAAMNAPTTNALLAMAALVRKDLVLYFSNRRALIMSIVAPILIAAFFGSLFGSGGAKPAHIKVAVIDADGSPVSRQIVDAMRADETLDVVDATDLDALAQLQAGKVPAAVTLPAGFGAAAARALFGTGTKPELLLRIDPSQKMAAQIVRGLLAQHVMQTVSRSVFSGESPTMAETRDRVAASKSMPDEQRKELVTMFDSIARVQAVNAAALATPPAGVPASGNASAAAGAANSVGGLSLPYALLEQETTGSRLDAKYNSYSHAFAGMGIQFVLLGGVEFGIALLAMRRLGLWKRLRAAPLSRSVLLGSRVLSGALTSLFALAVIYVVAIAAFGVRIDGSVIGLAAVLIAFALMTASFGLMIAAIGRTPEATRGLAILVTLLMVMLGGAWVPAFIFPAWLQQISLFVPTRWALDGLDAMSWRGQPLDAALLPVGVLLGFAAGFALLAIARFDWEE